MPLENSPTSSPCSEVYFWIPTEALVPGMVIARPVLGRSHNQVTLRISEGSTITANTIDQLTNKGIECAAVFQDAPTDETAHTEALKFFEQRMADIFGAQPDEACQQLMSALLAERRSKC